MYHVTQVSPDPITLTVIAAGLTPTAIKLLEKTLGPAADEVGEQLRARVHGFFQRNRETVVNAAAEMVEASGREVREVPLRTALRILEGASREDDPELQGRWAALLANVGTADEPDDFPPIFADTLSQLTPFAARVLDAYAVEATERMAAPSTRPPVPRGGASIREVATRLGESNLERIEFALDVLMRQNLLEREPTMHWGTKGDSYFVPETDADIRPTLFGRRFLAACMPPTPSHGS
jgi:hypothetical protein